MCRRAKENHKERGTENTLQETHFHYLGMKNLLGNSNWKKTIGILELKNFRVEVVYIYISKNFNIDQCY
jgi:hypothetical protein